MKIIAKIDDNTFLIEATKDEIANLHGYDNAYQIAAADQPRMFSVNGRPPPVSHIHTAAKGLHAYQAKELARAQEAVDALQETIKKAREVFGIAG